MARNIAAAGHELFVNDVRADACDRLAADGATVIATPAAVARHSETVLISVPGPVEAKDVMSGPDGLLAGLGKGMLVIDTTTISPRQSKEHARQCAETGTDYLDSPVSGGQHGAEAGDLTAMVGGGDAAYARALPILRCVATEITHIGPSGSASAIKLINQVIYIAYMAAFAEGLALGEDHGLSVDTMLDVLGTSAAGHEMMSTKYDEIRGLSDAPGFPVNRALLFCDLNEDACADFGYTTPVLEAVSAALRRADALGHGGDDVIRARRLYRSGDGEA